MIHAMTTEPRPGLLVGVTGRGGGGVGTTRRVGAGIAGTTPPYPPGGSVGHPVGAVDGGTFADGAAVGGLCCGDAGSDCTDGVGGDGADDPSRGARDPVQEARPTATRIAAAVRQATTIRVLIAIYVAFRWAGRSSDISGQRFDSFKGVSGRLAGTCRRTRI
jgi:hypothetical protein